MRLTRTALLVLVASLWGCSPSMNWRVLALDGTRLQAQLPCKPDRTSRQVPMGTQMVELQVAGCEAGGAVLAVMTTPLPAGTDANALLQGWQQVTLGHVRAQEARRAPWHASGMLPLADAVRVSANGQHPDGQPVHMQAVWGAWSEDGQLRLLHAVVYSSRASEEPAQTLFESFKP